jgi:hypothetical protein
LSDFFFRTPSAFRRRAGFINRCAHRVFGFVNLLEMPVIAAASSYLAYVQKRGGLSQQKGALRGTAVVACLLFAARATALARHSIFFLANREEPMPSEVGVF